MSDETFNRLCELRDALVHLGLDSTLEAIEEATLSGDEDAFEEALDCALEEPCSAAA